MTLAGVDTAVFMPSSLRSASSSKATNPGVRLDVILKYGGVEILLYIIAGTLSPT